MPDLRTALIQGYQRNIDRYCRLLATQLTPLEREYIHKQIAQQRTELERLMQLSRSVESDHASADTVIAANALKGGEGSRSQA